MANVNYDILITRLLSSGYTFPFMFGITPTMLSATTSNINMSPNTRYSGATVDQWYQPAGFVTGFTNDKLNVVRSYDNTDPYIPYLVLNDETYINYIGDTISSGVTMVTIEGEPMTYVVDASADSPNDLVVIGTDGQTTGLRYDSYSGRTYNIIKLDGTADAKLRTDVRYVGEGWNITNVDLSAITKTEYLLGIAYPPEVQSDIFIDRGSTTVMEDHLRLGEIKGLDALLDYGNGYYKVGL